MGIHFFQDRVDGIVFQKLEADVLNIHEKISDNEIALLMQSNAAGMEWKQVKATSFGTRDWQTSNSELFASYDIMKHSFMILTGGFCERASAEKKSEEGAKLKGF